VPSFLRPLPRIRYKQERANFCRASTSNNAYKRRFKKREASKNAAAAASKHAPQTRAKSTLDPPVLKVPGAIIEKDDFDLHWHLCLPVPDQLKLSEFTHHEQLLHSVDSFIRGVFDPGNKGWSADVTDFLGHVGNGSPTSYYQWRSASDRCHSVALLVRAGHQGKAQTTLERLFQSLVCSFDIATRLSLSRSGGSVFGCWG
jgi:hypothetical protein